MPEDLKINSFYDLKTSPKRMARTVVAVWKMTRAIRTAFQGRRYFCPLA